MHHISRENNNNGCEELTGSIDVCLQPFTDEDLGTTDSFMGVYNKKEAFQEFLLFIIFVVRKMRCYGHTFYRQRTKSNYLLLSNRFINYPVAIDDFSLLQLVYA